MSIEIVDEATGRFTVSVSNRLDRPLLLDRRALASASLVTVRNRKGKRLVPVPGFAFTREFKDEYLLHLPPRSVERNRYFLDTFSAEVEVPSLYLVFACYDTTRFSYPAAVGIWHGKTTVKTASIHMTKVAD